MVVKKMVEADMALSVAVGVCVAARANGPV